MSRSLTIIPIATAALALGVSSAACAQDTAQTPAVAVDSNAMFAGDWEFSAQTRDSTIGGVWRVNYLDGRFSGVVIRQSACASDGSCASGSTPPAPIRSFTVRNGRNFTMTVDFNAETWTFSGRLENARSINGSLSTRGGIGRVRAQKRS